MQRKLNLLSITNFDWIRPVSVVPMAFLLVILKTFRSIDDIQQFDSNFLCVWSMKTLAIGVVMFMYT